MVRFILSALIVFLNFELYSQQNLAKGIVFHDLNRNGKLDRSERGIPNVAVSNGEMVVLTDQHGKYSLTVDDDSPVFVIKPADYQFAVDNHNLPQFYYLHKPDGSPELKYQGVSSSGKLPASINFPLYHQPSDSVFKMIAITDPQPYTELQITYHDKDIVESMKQLQGISMGVNLGDIVGDRLEFFEGINRANARTGFPWFNVIGNHDINFDATKTEHNDETFERVYGPSTYAFNHGKVHFIVLNNIRYPNDLTDYLYVGGITERQFSFIANSLNHVSADHLVVLLMHIPLYNIDEWGITFWASHRQRLFELLKNHPHTLSLSGHMHTQLHHYFGPADGWTGLKPHHHYTVGAASGDWWSGEFKPNGVPVSLMSDGSPNGFTVFTFNGNKYQWDYISAGYDLNYRMRIYAPRKLQMGKTNSAELFVNFFQGSERDSVFFRIQESKWLPMHYTLEPDPTMTGIRYQWDTAVELPEGRRPSNPSICKHLWKARFPRNLKPGLHTIEIKVLHGNRQFTETAEIEVADPE